MAEVQTGYSRVRERGKEFDNAPKVVATHDLYYKGKVISHQEYTNYPGNTDPYSYENTFDEVHKKSRGGKYRTGGPFLKRETFQRTSPFNGTIRRDWGTSTSPWASVFQGKMHAMLASNEFSLGFFGELPDEDWFDVSGYGPEGFNRFKPGAPPVSAGVFIGELKDLPRMLKKASYAHKNVGSHYLNAQFGWLPFVSDLKRMYDLAFDLERRLQNIQRMNGKWHTRGGTLLNESSTDAMPDDTVLRLTPANSYVLDTSKASNSYQLVDTKKVWFKGRFCYYIPEAEFRRPEWRLNTIRKMYGLSLTPDLVWNLTPWSWLVDYFTNVGDIMQNLSGGVIDGVVSKYAYVMGTRERKFVQTSTCGLKAGGSVSASIERGHTSKSRVGGSPFSFAMSGDLSTRQTAILGALGISRAF